MKLRTVMVYLVLFSGVFLSYVGYLIGTQQPIKSTPFKQKIQSFFEKSKMYTKQWEQNREKSRLSQTPQSNDKFTFSVEYFDYYDEETKENIHLEIQLLLPVNSVKETPIYLHYHGGGFCQGHSNGRFFLYKGFAENGFIVVSPEFRLAPDYPLSSQVFDAMKTIEWIKQKFGSEKKIVMGGDSSGGGLVEIVTHKMRNEGYSLYPKDQLMGVLISPWICFKGEEHCPVKYDPAYSWNSLFLDTYCLRSFSSAIDYSGFEKFSLFENLNDLPPRISFIAEFDPLFNEELKYAKDLQKVDERHQFLIIEDECHGFQAKFDYSDIIKNIFIFYSQN